MEKIFPVSFYCRNVENDFEISPQTGPRCCASLYRLWLFLLGKSFSRAFLSRWGGNFSGSASAKKFCPLFRVFPTPGTGYHKPFQLVFPLEMMAVKKKLQCIWALAWNEEEEEEKTCTLILHAVEENFWAMFLENKIKLFPRGKEEKTLFFFAHPPPTWYYNVFILLLSIQQWPRAKLVSNNSSSPETDKHQCRRRDRFIFIQFLVIV